MQIEKYQPAQHESLAEFWRAIYKEMDWNVVIDGIDNPQIFFHLPDGFLLTISKDNAVVGCSGVKPSAKEVGIIKRFYLAPELRGTGMSAQLLEATVNEAVKRGFTKLVLDVYYKNLRAVRFYEKHGFTKFDPVPEDDWSESQRPDKFVYFYLLLASNAHRETSLFK